MCIRDRVFPELVLVIETESMIHREENKAFMQGMMYSLRERSDIKIDFELKTTQTLISRIQNCKNSLSSAHTMENFRNVSMFKLISTIRNILPNACKHRKFISKGRKIDYRLSRI